jgi:hypothetical protein
MRTHMRVDVHRVLAFGVNSNNAVSGQSDLDVLLEEDDSVFPCRNHHQGPEMSSNSSQTSMGKESTCCRGRAGGRGGGAHAIVLWVSIRKALVNPQGLNLLPGEVHCSKHRE